MKRRSLYVLLWVTYLLTLVCAILDLFVFEGLDSKNVIAFYILTNGILFYRLFGVYWYTIILHAACHFGALVLTVLEKDKKFMNWSMIVPLAVQLVLALHLVVFRRGRSADEQACRSGVHAHIGLIVVVMFFLSSTCMFVRNPHGTTACMVYLLLFLGIILTPHFHGLSKQIARLRARKAHRKSNERMTNSTSKVSFAKT